MALRRGRVHLAAQKQNRPAWQWPMDSLTFSDYLSSKYPDIDTNTEIHHYLKTVTYIDNVSGTRTIEKTIIDETAYDDLAETTRTYTLPNGGSTTIITDKSTVSIFEYENDENEKNRNIQLINSIYADQIESEFKSLMAT